MAQEARARSPVQSTLLLCSIVAIAASEAVFSYGNAGVGLLIALFTTVGIYLTVSITKVPDEVASCGQALALVPIYILLTASLPWFFVNRQIILPAAYLVVIGVCAWYIYFKRLPLAAVGLAPMKNMWRYVALGAVVSVPLAVVEFFILNTQRETPTFQLTYLARDVVYMLVFVGVGEEVLFRGIVQNNLGRVYGKRWGLLLSAGIFGIMHLGWRSGYEVAFTFGIGWMLGWIYWRSGSLVVPIVIHGLANTLLVAVIPYLSM